MAKVIPATSKQVRTWFAQNPKKIPTGAEKSAQVSCKGRIKPTAIETFNSHAKQHGMQYTEGAEATRPLPYKAKNNRIVTVHLPKSEVRALAGKPNSRGPLSKADLEFAGQMYLSRLGK